MEMRRPQFRSDFYDFDDQKPFDLLNAYNITTILPIIACIKTKSSENP